MKTFSAFVRKEFLHVFRDNKTMLMLFGLPIVMITLFGFALSNEIKHAPIAVLDRAHDPSSIALISRLQASGQFKLNQFVQNEKQAEEVFRKGKVKLIIVFPPGFRKELMHTGSSSMQILADASDPNTASTLTTYVQAVVNDYQKELLAAPEYALQMLPEIRMLYNPELKGSTNFVPGVIALVLLLVCVLMTSVSIVREKELGTMEILLVSPLNPFMVVFSKAIPYFVLSLMNLTLILLLSVFALDLPIKGSLILLYTESALFILTALSLGLLISTATESQQTAMLLSLMGMLIPTLLFTGFMFPIENMPKPLQIISNIVPAKWYYRIIHSVMIKGTGFQAIWKETLVLAGMTIIFLGLSIKKFKIRLA